MNFINYFKNAIKGKNKICEPLFIYIIIGILQFVILYKIYFNYTDININNLENINNNELIDKPNKQEYIMIINFMLYLYVIFGMFLQLLCKNNMKNAVWFIILYPFICRLVWIMIK